MKTQSEQQELYVIVKEQSGVQEYYSRTNQWTTDSHEAKYFDEKGDAEAFGSAVVINNYQIINYSMFRAILDHVAQYDAATKREVFVNRLTNYDRHNLKVALWLREQFPNRWETKLSNQLKTAHPHK